MHLAMSFVRGLAILAALSAVGLARVAPASAAAVFNDAGSSGTTGRTLDPTLSSSSKAVALGCSETALVNTTDTTCTSILTDNDSPLTLSEFIALNQKYNSNFTCSSLTVGEIVCLSDSSNSTDTSSSSSSSSDGGSGSSEGASAAATTTSTSTSSSASPAATYYPVPLSNCTVEHVISSTDTCASVAANYSITVAELEEYNDITSLTCNSLGSYKGYSLCVSVIVPAIYPPTLLSNCTVKYTIQSNDTCDSVAASYSITVDDLYAYNNISSLTCDNFGGYAGDAVCVSVIVPAIYYPTLISNCTVEHTIVSNDTCESVCDEYSITLDELYAYNNITNLTCANFGGYSGQQVCVSDIVPAIYPPTPLSNCTVEHTIQVNDTCDSVASAYSITIEDLYAYNDITNLTCANFGGYANDSICVSVIVPAIYPPTPVDGCTETYIITSSDTCDSVASTYGISVDNLLSYNDITTLTCDNFGGYSGDAICVSTAQPSTTSSSDNIVATIASVVDSVASEAESVVSSVVSEVTSAAEATTTSSSSTTSCKSCGNSYATGSDYGNAHNYFRGLYGLSSFTVDSTLEAAAATALEYYNGAARTCGDITHDSTAGAAGEGENLWAGESTSSSYQTDITINNAVNDWMSEDSDYFSWSDNGADPTAAWDMGESTGSEVGHFTQIVWSSSTLVGCAKRTCTFDSTYPYGVMVACRYKSAGNIFSGGSLEDPFSN
ncbi:hypothetical protein HK405_003347 [Cladochytrium tenue]|nr:hypothetical protein HK405_003347 [Cladochytrium tenue]